ncbi:isochorismatase family protein [Mucilaginibacter jinjuensis]|uniref:Isochorismatase family protein n=1 Tax=Mucilaginibacter jinjuensis TaxID=1176721 RepID=A0ABY7T465_9SPHI|nr:isochorismatase family protein [Mucilaginibacter jinjuensis]WCT11079.1 isochorismatase family protein [Mucilaginibacter jinjuensis]
MITAIDAKTALVLIDLQKGIMGLPTAHSTEQVLEKSIELIKAFRSKNLPIVFVNVNPLGAKWTQARVEQSTAPKGEEAIEQARLAMEASGFFDLVPQLDVQPDDILITKNTWSAFYNTPLHEILQKLDITGIVLAGVATSIGVEGTARNASEHGYNITFVEDAMTDMHLSAHENSLKSIFPRIGELGTTADVISTLQKN